MGKKFGMKNLVGAMMALTAMNVGSPVSHAVNTPEQKPSSQVESVELFGGEFTKAAGEQNEVRGRKSARAKAKSMIEKEVLGSKASAVSSDDVGLRVIENALYRAAIRGASKDCVGVGEEATDTRSIIYRKFSDPNPDEDLVYPLMTDKAAVAAVKENFPKLLAIVRRCYNKIHSSGEKQRGSASMLVSCAEYFAAEVDSLDGILRCMPSVTEAALRLVLQNFLFGNSLKDSLLGSNFELDAHSDEILNYVKAEFDQIKEKWDNRTIPLVSAVVKGKNVTSDYLMYGNAKNAKNKKSKK